jgi:hypothetical protein
LKITRSKEFQKKVDKLKRKYFGENVTVEDADVLED